MARNRRTQRKQVSAVRDLPADVVVAIAEVLVISSLSYSFCVSDLFIFMINVSNGKNY